MTVHPRPSDFETRTNETYAALMWALSRPGIARTLPTPGSIGIVETLIDRECSVFCAEPPLARAAERAGAALVSPERADHLFYGELPETDVLAWLRQGSDLYPDEGATLVCDGHIGSGSSLRLTGPGCDGPVDVRVGGLPDDFWSQRARLMRYPMGFELFVLDGPHVLGVPRSCKVEVL